MAHSHHHHSHEHQVTNFNRAFALATSLNIGFVVVEALFGFFTSSLALLADAGHNLSDVLGLLLAWGASWLAQRPPSKRYTYGLRRSSILAALINSVVLLVAMGGITWEAIHRLTNPTPISGTTIIGVALIGVAINTATALLFISGREQDLNIKGAFLHMAADALVSVGVVLAGIAILTTGWLWFDPAISLIIVIVVVVGTWQLLKDALNLSLDAVPNHIEPAAVKTFLTQLPGVAQVHDLHIWAMSTTETALTVHLVMPEGHPGEMFAPCSRDRFLAYVCQELHDHFGIEHSTIQIEIKDSEGCCIYEPEHKV
ncbi:cation diffusion facilitator family transporter [Stanieria sp. NIES-3757]|nr:cation diffusion facilitator family transporter [Stanieria sp. NIES-3757]